jgi:glycosyltransferase involved in cell wall biosynthesis
MPKIKTSICIPAYKNPDFLQRCLRSAVTQNTKDYEIIVTDDSPDDSAQQVVNSFAHDHLQYFRNKTRLGSPENWNEAIRKAHGEYIKIVHHDDWFPDADCLQKFVNALDQNPAVDFVFSATQNCFSSLELAHMNKPKPEQLEALKKEPTILAFGNFIGDPSACMFRHKHPIEFNKKLIWTVDFDFYIRILQINNNYIYLDEPLINVTTGDHNQISSECTKNPNIQFNEYFYLYSRYHTLNNEIRFKEIFIALLTKFQIKNNQQIEAMQLAEKMPDIIQRIFCENKATLHKISKFLKKLFIITKQYIKRIPGMRKLHAMLLFGKLKGRI